MSLRNYLTVMKGHEVLCLWEKYALSPEHYLLMICHDSERDIYDVEEIKFVERYHEYIEMGFLDVAKKLYRRQTELEKSKVSKWLDAGKAISVSKGNYAKELSGRDGTNYGFKYRDEFPLSQLDWWEKGQYEWKPIIDWYHDFVNWLKSELDKND